MRGGSLAVRLIDALFVAANECPTLQIRTWRLYSAYVHTYMYICCLNVLFCCFWHLYASTQLSKDLPNNGINGRQKRDVNGLFATCCDFYRRHTRCVWSLHLSVVSSVQFQFQSLFHVPAPWTLLVFYGCHTYCPSPMAIINCSLKLKRVSWRKFKFLNTSNI